MLKIIIVLFYYGFTLHANILQCEAVERKKAMLEFTKKTQYLNTRVQNKPDYYSSIEVELSSRYDLIEWKQNLQRLSELLQSTLYEESGISLENIKVIWPFSKYVQREYKEYLIAACGESGFKINAVFLESISKKEIIICPGSLLYSFEFSSFPNSEVIFLLAHEYGHALDIHSVSTRFYRKFIVEHPLSENLRYNEKIYSPYKAEIVADYWATKALKFIYQNKFDYEKSLTIMCNYYDHDYKHFPKYERANWIFSKVRENNSSP